MLDAVSPFLEGFALLIRQGVELVLRHLASLDERHRSDSHLSEREREAFRLRLLLQLAGHLLAFVLNVLHHVFDAMGIIIALEDGGNVAVAVIYQVFHVPRKNSHHAAGQAKGCRLGRLLKVVDVSSIRGDRLLGRDALQVCLQRGVSSRAGDACYEKVEAGSVYVQRQLKGADSAFLTNSAVEGSYLVSGLETKVIGVAGLFEFFCGDFQTFDAHS